MSRLKINTEVRQRSISTNTDFPVTTRKENKQPQDDTFELIESSGDSSDQYTCRPLKQSEKDIYETQLNQLQEQLVAIMIEKESLATELKTYKENDRIEILKAEIDLERQRYSKLEKKYQKMELDRSDRQRSGEELEREPSKGKSEKPAKGVRPGKPKPGQRKSIISNAWEKIVSGLYDVMDDFSEDKNSSMESKEDEGDPLTVKTLKENIKRLKNAAKPYVNTVKGIQNLLKWKSPAYTLIVFMVYLFAVWRGLLLQVVLTCLIFRLFVSFLQSLGIRMDFEFFDPGMEDKGEEDVSLGVSEKFNLVLQVARKAQNAFGTVADGLEKVKSVLTWRHKPAAKKLFSSLCWSLVASLVLPSEYIFICIGLGVGIKMFVIQYFFDKYPRLNQKYNTMHQLWQDLPTDAEWVKDQTRSEIDKYIIPDNAEEAPAEEQTVSTKSMPSETSISNDDKAFCQLFSLPFTECPVKGWRGGKRCSLINKDKNFMSAFKNGKLYLTKSFICFERKKTPCKSNLLIPLANITKLQKAKPFAAMIGTGMAIEVTIKEKSFIFGGLIGRDDAYDCIIDQGLQNSLPWALGLPVEEDSESSTTLRRRTNAEKTQNFTFADDYVDSD